MEGLGVKPFYFFKSGHDFTILGWCKVFQDKTVCKRRGADFLSYLFIKTAQYGSISAEQARPLAGWRFGNYFSLQNFKVFIPIVCTRIEKTDKPI